jgi:hypothetical protein
MIIYGVLSACLEFAFASSILRADGVNAVRTTSWYALPEAILGDGTDKTRTVGANG